MKACEHRCCLCSCRPKLIRGICPCAKANSYEQLLYICKEDSNTSAPQTTTISRHDTACMLGNKPTTLTACISKNKVTNCTFEDTHLWQQSHISNFENKIRFHIQGNKLTTSHVWEQTHNSQLIGLGTNSQVTCLDPN